MMTRQIQGVVTPAVQTYFAGERGEMFVILTGSMFTLLVAILLLAGSKGWFSKGLGWTLVVGALLLSAAAVSLLLRDASLSRRILSEAESAAAHEVVEREVRRVEAIISNYSSYRWGASLLAVVALFCTVFVPHAGVFGICAGVLVLVAAQLMIDNYSEARALEYLDRLTVAISSAPAICGRSRPWS